MWVCLNLSEDNVGDTNSASNVGQRADLRMSLTGMGPNEAYIFRTRGELKMTQTSGSPRHKLTTATSDWKSGTAEGSKALKQ